jgi:protein-tyrosine phosphatase
MSVLEAVSTRKVLLCTIAAVICLSFSPASAQEAISTPILTSAPNFRDLAGISASNGGTGFVDTTSHDGVMRTGVFYRSDALNNLSNADSATITSLHVGRDIDLRTPNEINGAPGSPPAPDVVPNGATYTNINIYGTQGPIPSPFGGTPAAAITFMQTGYQAFVTDPLQRAGFREVLLTLANDSSPDLWHCSGGKDRTGWTANLMQSIAGVSSATIMQDYLATNSYTAALMATTKAGLQLMNPGWDPATIDVLLGVQSSYLQAGLDQVIATYGSMYAYLTQGLGLSQADIYVLRAKMVYYLTLPGQSGFFGNAAAGAGFLNALQNSPLSGHYTAYNYFLQSAIDAGTLWGVETQAGGQVHADAASYLLREPLWIDDAIRPYTDGRDLRVGQTNIWMAGLGGGFWSDGRTGVAGSTETSAGTLIGATHRFNDQTSGDVGIGYNWGSVESAGADATLNTFAGTIGGRYGFSGLESGPYMTARADAGWVDYKSNRALGGGLGTATGNTTGAFYSGLAGLGDVIRLAPFTITPQIGVRVTDVTLGSFNESGSDLALAVNGINKTSPSVLLDLDVRLDRQQFRGWAIEPAVTLGYERILNNPQVESTGTLDGFAVSQYSAFDSHDLMKAGLGITAQHNAFTVKAGVNGIVGDGSGSAGIGGQLSVAYRF